MLRLRRISIHRLETKLAAVIKCSTVLITSALFVVLLPVTTSNCEIGLCFSSATNNADSIALSVASNLLRIPATDAYDAQRFHGITPSAVGAL